MMMTTEEKFNFYWKFIERPKRILSRFWFNTILKKDNRYFIQKEVNKHRNELVLDTPSKVIRLIGWTDEYEDDYYWVVYEYRGKKLHLYSCVGGFVWLKGKLNAFDYYDLEYVWKLNNENEQKYIKSWLKKGHKLL